MKNTVKKILALVFVVAMVCTLAVPALAADAISVNVTVVSEKADGTRVTATETVSITNYNASAAIKAFKTFDVAIANGKVNKVNDLKATDVDGVFKTGSWAVAVNGKIVSEDLSTVAVAKNDQVVVFFNNPTFSTKLAQYDASKKAEGIISFYYYDAAGAKQPLVGATVGLQGLTDRVSGKATFTTDEKGQIWVAPQDLTGTPIVIESLSIAALKAIKDDNENYTDAEREYYNEHLNSNLVNAAVVDAKYNTIETADMYLTAGATGDMTVVYVLVAAAAIVTLGAVVVMKKKSVKAN